MPRALLVGIALVFRALSPVLLALVPTIAGAQGNPLGPEFRVNTYTTYGQRLAAVAVDPAGLFVVVWASGHDGFGDGVFGQWYGSSGAPVGPEFLVNTHTPYAQVNPSATAGSGTFVVAWQSFQQDGSGYGVFAQRYVSPGVPSGPEFRVNTFTTAYQADPSVATELSSGNFVVVWRSFEQDGDGFGIFGQRYAASGPPLGLEFRVNSFTTSYQNYPSVAVDSSGFVVVWQSFDQDGSAYGIFGQRYAPSGIPVGGEFRVNTYTTGNQFKPVVAAGNTGGFVVVWTSGHDGDGAGVFGQRYASTGAPVGGEFRVNTFTTDAQQLPLIAADAAGNFVVTWQSYTQDGSSDGVFGQRFAASGAPLGPELRVNTFTTSFQGQPSVAANVAGNFVVVWQSEGQDGSYLGVFGQRYGLIVPVELMLFGVE
jgi:hypothetical protein